MEGIEEVGEMLAGRKVNPEGSLRISAPVALAQRVLKEPLTSFIMKHPGIHLHVELSDRFVDLVGEGFDLAIRIGQGFFAGRSQTCRCPNGARGCTDLTYGVRDTSDTRRPSNMLLCTTDLIETPNGWATKVWRNRYKS